ncbi:MAG TPA: fatty acid desaturase, partial [Arenicellales bacterium]|nr:fatty acid desaturase [Arenicellales bacterium]
MTHSPNSNGHAALRRLVQDLFDPDPRIYWTDFLFHAALGWTAFAGAVAWTGWPALLSGLVAVLALYRAVIFTHELVHLRRGSLPGFRLAWDALCGVPLMAPSFLYDGVHQEHHFRHQYGTPQDGEYLPFGRPPRWRIPLYLVSHAVIPLLAVLRFGVIAPLSWAWPASRAFVLRRMSSLSIDPAYVRRLPDDIPRSWRLQEAAAAAVVWLVAAGLWAGWISPQVPAVWYAVVTTVLVFN